MTDHLPAQHRPAQHPPSRHTLARCSTAAISDALDRMGLPGALLGIAALRPGQQVCGPAFTVGYEPVDAHGGVVGDFLDDVAEGAVVVIANDARTDCTVWGGIMTQVAAARGIAGTVVDGVCRDVAVVDATGYPIWSVGRYMRTGKDRVRLAAVQQPVELAGLVVEPGDVVCGDDDGVVVVPAGRADEVAALAAAVERAEDAIVAAVRGGATLAQARAEHGYHTLQTADPALVPPVDTSR